MGKKGGGLRTGGGSEIFDDLLRKGSELSHQSSCITNLPLLLQFQIIFFSTSIRHSQK